MGSAMRWISVPPSTPPRRISTRTARASGWTARASARRSERLALRDHLRATLFDDARDYRPFIETYTSEKLPWAQVPAVRSFEKFPAPEEFPGLVRAFAEQAG